MSWRRIFLILWRLELRRLINRLQAWQGPRGTLGLGLLLLGFILSGLYLVMDSSLDRLLDAALMREVLQRSPLASSDLLRFTRYEDVPDVSARLLILFLQGIWLSSLLLKWGHWQSLQRDAEWEWFAARPWPSWTLFVQRCLVESLWPQIFSLFIGSFFFLLALKRGLSILEAGLWTLTFVVMFQALFAAPRFLVDLWLRQRWTASRVRAWRGISGLLGVGSLLLSIQTLSADPGWTLVMVMQLGDFLDLLPAGFALSALLQHGAGGWRGALWLILGVIFVHGLCYLAAARLLRQPLPGFQGWTDRDHTPRVDGPQVMRRLWHWLHPLTRRDVILLCRDRHFLLQILVAPLMIALAPQSFPSHDPAATLVLAFGTGLLFLWSAVFHILPMEGQSLWMLFTWPQSLTRFLWRRLSVLLNLAGVYTLLVLFGGGLQWDRTPDLWRLPYLALGLVGFGLILTALAVLTYKPGRSEGSERPRIFLHYGMLIPGGLYGWLFLRPEPSFSLLGLLILSVAAAFIWWHMVRTLPRLLEPDAPVKRSWLMRP